MISRASSQCCLISASESLLQIFLALRAARSPNVFLGQSSVPGLASPVGFSRIFFPLDHFSLVCCFIGPTRVERSSGCRIRQTRSRRDYSAASSAVVPGEGIEPPTKGL